MMASTRRHFSSSGPSVTGSVVAFTFDFDGHPCVSIERGPIARLIDDDKDGRYDRALRDPAYSQVFRDYGLDLARGASGPEAAQRIRATSIGVELAAALDDWALCVERRGPRPTRPGRICWRSPALPTRTPCGISCAMPGSG